MSSLQVVHVRGKRGRQVPILLDRDIIKGIDVLIEKRDEVGVDSNNIYLFATPTRGSLRPLRGNDCLNNILQSIDGLSHPDRIKSTALRKYCATVSQIADLSENDLRWLADHLGHNVDVHREYYRLRESTVELAKVSRMLLCIDEGKGSSLAGKSLADITVEGM